MNRSEIEPAEDAGDALDPCGLDPEASLLGLTPIF
jgi:hypothetical protein